jgi:hypothetical protein
MILLVSYVIQADSSLFTADKAAASKQEGSFSSDHNARAEDQVSFNVPELNTAEPVDNNSQKAPKESMQIEAVLGISSPLGVLQLQLHTDS